MEKAKCLFHITCIAFQKAALVFSPMIRNVHDSSDFEERLYHSVMFCNQILSVGVFDAK